MKYSLFMLLLTVPIASAQVPIGPMPRPVLEETRSFGTGEYEWKRLPAKDDPSVRPIFCMKAGVVVGTWQKGKYIPFDVKTGKYGEPCNPPIPLDANTAKVIESFDSANPSVVDGKTIANFGVDTPNVPPRGDSVPPDDSNKWRLTVRSDDKSVIEAVKQAIVPWKDKLLVQFYPPGHWALEPGLDFGVVHLEQPPRSDGKAVLVSTIRDTENIAERVTTVLRKADPSFNANVVPDTSKSNGLDDILAWLKSPGPGGIPWGIVVAVGAYIWLQMKKSQKV